jgi:FKBP-type peptidyl-prolyl cis-trans isomerase 2
MKVAWGSLVSLDYDVLLDSGEQVDSSEKNGPLRLRVGVGKALPGLGERLVGLHLGDERLIRLTPPGGLRGLGSGRGAHHAGVQTDGGSPV